MIRRLRTEFLLHERDEMKLINAGKVEEGGEVDFGERKLVPAGVHEMEVVFSEDGTNQYRKTDENPDGDCIKLRLSLGREYGLVFEDLMADMPGWRAAQVAAAFGVNPEDGLEADDLLGKTVKVQIGHFDRKAGGQGATVKKFFPAPVSKAPAEKKPRKTNAVALTDEVDDGDVPF